MTIQDQVPDLSICQEAKEKGVEIESIYLWAEYNPIGSTCVKTKITQDEDNVINESFGTPKFYPAPLTDEILKVLPRQTQIQKFDNFYEVYYETIKFQDKKLSNALLRLAIKLKEENII